MHRQMPELMQSRKGQPLLLATLTAEVLIQELLGQDTQRLPGLHLHLTTEVLRRSIGACRHQVIIAEVLRQGITVEVQLQVSINNAPLHQAASPHHPDPRSAHLAVAGESPEVAAVPAWEEEEEGINSLFFFLTYFFYFVA